MVCIPGRIREGKTEKEYAKYKSQMETTDGKRHQVDCEICSASLAAGSYRSHLESQHDIFWSFAIQQDIVIDRPAVIYRAIELIAADTYPCPVPNCVGEASTRWALKRHFVDRYPQDLVVILSKGSTPLPKCKKCGM
jgi:hypothetical protein